MNWYSTIKGYYDLGIFKEDLNDSMYIGRFVEFGKITPEEYRQITGKLYKKTTRR